MLVWDSEGTFKKKKFVNVKSLYNLLKICYLMKVMVVSAYNFMLSSLFDGIMINSP